ncbi:MAG: signal peptide peptidase SppA [Flavobacteriaceae bacterium]
MKFLQNLLANIMGFFISLLLLFFLMIGIGVAMIGSMEEEIPELTSNSVLELSFNSQVMDFYPSDQDPLLKLLDLDSPYIGLDQIISSIDKAAQDNKVKGISLQLNTIQAGMSQVKSIRQALQRFKNSGKSVFAYADFYDQKAYYLASVADRVYVNPVGGVQWKGLSSEVLFFKDFEDKYGVKMEVIRHGKYKSAMEPFLENKMSPANRDQMTSLLGDLWSGIKVEVGQDRDLNEKELQRIADESLARSPQRAIKVGLIDELAYRDQYKDALVDQLDLDTYKSMDLESYMLGISSESYQSQGNIGVLYAQGEIIYGEGDESSIGQELMLKSIRKLKKDDDIKAVVLRVNSPGGSALSSDIILRALEELQEEKPLVVSMGDYAASGGYYIACSADYIVAQSNTITGSIGVFGALPNMSKLSKEMGINADRVSTSKAPEYSVFEPISKGFYDLTQEGIERVYQDFIGHVAKGRKMQVDQVDAIAQGRVWTGVQAEEIGLVDEIGSLDLAIERAAELVDMENYGRMNYPEYDSDFSSSFKNFPLARIKENLLLEYLPIKELQELKAMKKTQNSEGIQMKMPFVLKIN